MCGSNIPSQDTAEFCGTRATGEAEHRLRLLIVMAQGLAGVLPDAWRSYARIEEARASALEALRNPQVLRVAILEDNNPLRFVEWVAEMELRLGRWRVGKTVFRQQSSSGKRRGSL